MREKELFEKINNDKDYRSKILIDLNVALQLAERRTYTPKGEISPEEYKLAVVSLEVENEQLKNNWNELKKWLEEYLDGARSGLDSYDCGIGDCLDDVLKKIQELEGSNE